MLVKPLPIRQPYFVANNSSKNAAFGSNHAMQTSINNSIKTAPVFKNFNENNQQDQFEAIQKNKPDYNNIIRIVSIALMAVLLAEALISRKISENKLVPIIKRFDSQTGKNIEKALSYLDDSQKKRFISEFEETSKKLAGILNEKAIVKTFIAAIEKPANKVSSNHNASIETFEALFGLLA